MSYLGSLIKVCDISLYFLKCFQSCAAAQLAVQAQSGTMQHSAGPCRRAAQCRAVPPCGTERARAAVQHRAGPCRRAALCGPVPPCSTERARAAVQAQCGAVQARRGSSTRSLTARPGGCLKEMRIHWECSQNDRAIVRVFFGL